MSDRGIARVHYFGRQFLRTQDFADEQAYHVAMRRRHNIAHHKWGIVCGLNLVVEESNIFVQPGMAVDGYGRELILPQKQPISTGAFADKNSDVLNVWLAYDRVGTDRAPRGYAGCGDAIDSPFYRWQEGSRIHLDVPDTAFRGPRGPESVPEGDLDFDPSRTPPDDPQEDWPVFLGQMLRDPGNPDQPYSVDLDNRPYVGLRGEALIAPSGRARLQIGAELESDKRRFAVFVPEAESQVEPVLSRLEIDKDGQIGIRGDTTLHGDLSVVKRAIEFRAGTARSPDAPPWRVYHLEDTDKAEHKLCIEMARTVAGGIPGLNQVVIGTWSAEEETEEETFKACLTIRDDCSVTVHGNLIVEGTITGNIEEGVDKAPKRLSQEAKRLIQSGFLGGVSGANVLLGPLVRGKLLAELVASIRTAMKLSPEASMRAVAESLAGDPGYSTAFADLMKKEHPDLAKKLRAALEGKEGRPHEKDRGEG